jgi:hypothetical protein
MFGNNVLIFVERRCLTTQVRGEGTTPEQARALAETVWNRIPGHGSQEE